MLYEQAVNGEFALIIVGVAAVGFLSHRLKLPVIPCYLLAGVMLGAVPAWPGAGPSLYLLANLGMLFLLFGIGLEFNIRRLKRVLSPVILACALQTLLVVVIGLQVAGLFGWPMVDGLMLALLLGLSSGVVSRSVLQARGEDRHLEGQLSGGSLIIETLLGVALLLAWSARRSDYIPGLEHFWLTGLGLLMLVVLLFFLGRLLAPRLVAADSGRGGEEWLLLAGVGTALGISWLAGRFEFSAPLGALVAGAIFAQMVQSDALSRLLSPFRFVFGAVFFVVAGTQVGAGMLLSLWWVILPLFLVVGATKILGCWSGFFLAGKPSWASLQAATAKMQTGELAVILAVLGFSAGLLPAKLHALVLGVAILGMLLTSGALGLSGGFFAWLGKHLPRPLMLYGKIYHRLLHNASRRMDRNRLWRLTRRPMLQILFYSFIFIGILLATSILSDYLASHWADHRSPALLVALVWVGGGIACLPFLISTLRNLNVVVLMFLEGSLRKDAYRQLFAGRLGPALRLALVALVLIPVCSIYFAFAAQSLPSGWGLAAFLLAIVLLGGVMWKRMIRINSKMEYLFMESLNEETLNAEDVQRQAVLEEITSKYPWPVKVSALEVPESWGGRRLRDLPVREQSGAMIVAIGRGEHIVFDPGPGSPLFPGDRLYVFGQEREIERAGAVLARAPGSEATPRDHAVLEIETLYLAVESPLVGDTLAGADLRRRHGINILGIQRGETRITAPSADEILCEGDVLYVIGDRQAIEAFR